MAPGILRPGCMAPNDMARGLKSVVEMISVDKRTMSVAVLARPVDGSFFHVFRSVPGKWNFAPLEKRELRALGAGRVFQPQTARMAKRVTISRPGIESRGF